MNNNYIEDIIVVENSITNEQQSDLLKFVLAPNFPWFYNDGVIYKEDVLDNNKNIIEKGLNPFQMVHLITDVNNCLFLEKISPILNCLTMVLASNVQILKTKFNMLTKSNKKQYHWPHSDLDDYNDKILSALYYVNNSDGPTFLFNEFAPKKDNKVTKAVQIDPEQGKLVIFDSRRFHSSSSPVVNDKRIVLNVVFKIPED